MQCLSILNSTLINDRLHLPTGLALHTDMLHRQTARDTEGMWGGGGGERGEEIKG